MIEPFLLDLLSPRAEEARLVFADFLDERIGPTPVETYKMPNWLRLSWIRNRPRDAIGIRIHYRGGPATNWDVAMEMQVWLRSEKTYVSFDHWGKTVVDGQLCFVNEPYATAEDAIEHMRPLADHLGCALAFARQTWHGKDWLRTKASLVRVLLFPLFATRVSRDALV